VRPDLIEEDEAVRIDAAGSAPPAGALMADVGAILFGRPQDFF